jgi:hypothetical protein
LTIIAILPALGLPIGWPSTSLYFLSTVSNFLSKFLAQSYFDAPSRVNDATNCDSTHTANGIGGLRRPDMLLNNGLRPRRRAKDLGRIPNVGIFFTVRMKKWSFSTFVCRFPTAQI